MIVKKVTTLSVDVNNPAEFNWWQNNKEDLKKQGYILNESNTQCFFANYAETYSMNIGGDYGENQV